ncbi:uncharacterized protein LOC134257085 [Saccostrea cucullata]|uniref:uncharacterized protein LOC134257085 n=1 Tax=Saccostrea cuccullata TaxID=36930 RepID=UPI002ED41C99
MNNAVCNEEGNCECPVGYTGVTCEKDSRCDFEQEFCLKNSGNNTINFTRTSRERLIPSPLDGDHYAIIRSSQTCTTKKSGIMFSSKYVTGTVRVEFDYLVKGNGKLSFFYDAFIDSANHVYVSSTDDVWRSFNGTITTTKSKSFYGFRGNVGGDLTDNFQYNGVVAVDNVRITSINT